MKEKKEIKDIFMDGAIPPGFIADSIARHASKKNIGGHNIFLGQVRADEVKGKKVAAIEYETHREMALERMAAIREELFAQYDLTCLHVHHSLGAVQAGEICLFVFASSVHRKPAIEACAECVERIKKELPIWGKEHVEGEGYQWKVNT